MKRCAPPTTNWLGVVRSRLLHYLTGQHEVEREGCHGKSGGSIQQRGSKRTYGGRYTVAQGARYSSYPDFSRDPPHTPRRPETPEKTDDGQAHQQDIEKRSSRHEKEAGEEKIAFPAAQLSTSHGLTGSQQTC